MVRPAAAAGHFYPNQPEELSRQVESFCFVPPEAVARRAVACIVPHAGYMYSGRVAGAVYARVELPRHIILGGPRHYPRAASARLCAP
jgi:AmmeMemoRadiSam system protein B